jgi:hypothetical protein
MPLALLPWIAIAGLSYLSLKEVDDTLDAATRLTIALTVAGGGYVTAKAFKVI